MLVLRQQIEVTDVVHEPREQRFIRIDAGQVLREHMRDGGHLDAMSPRGFGEWLEHWAAGLRAKLFDRNDDRD